MLSRGWVSWLLLAVWASLTSKVGAIYSPIFGEMRGKLGGSVFSRNKGGPYVRAHAIPTNPNTARQQVVRNWVGYLASYWASTLSAAERAGWVEWAQTTPWLNSLGQSVYLTGLDWFVMVNARLLDVGDAVREECGDLSAPEGLLTLALAFTDADTITLTFTAALPSGGRLFAWGTGPINSGKDPNFRQCRLIGYTAADQASPATLELPYTMPDLMYLKVYAGVMDANGRVSVMITDRERYEAP